MVVRAQANLNGPVLNRYLLNKLYKVTYYLPNSTDDEDVSLALFIVLLMIFQLETSILLYTVNSF